MKVKLVCHCGKEFERYSGSIKVKNPSCSPECSWTEARRKKMSIVKKGNKNSLGKKNCLGKHWKFSKEALKTRPANFKGHKHSEASRLKMSLFRKGKRTGKNNPNWKGENAGYTALHTWIYRYLGKAKFCSFNILHKVRRFEWANKSHEYKRDLNDWMSLCPSCHRKYDNNYRRNMNTA